MQNKQQQMILVLATDGRANVADLERARAMEGGQLLPYSPIEDAIAAAHELRAAGILSLSLPDRKSVPGKEVPPFPVLHNLWVLLSWWNIT